MIVPASFAAVLGRTLDLFRNPGAKEDQKVQFRALAGLLRFAGVTFGVAGGRLVVNGTPLEDVAFTQLLQRLELHSISEIAIPADPPVSQLFELLRALADQPGQVDIPARLRASGTGGITVAMQAQSGGGPPSTVDRQDDPMAPAPPGTPKLDLGTEGILHGHGSDISAAPLYEMPPPPPPPPPPSLPPPSPPSGPSGVSSGERRRVASSGRAPALLVADLEANPKGAQIGDLLGQLVDHVAQAVREDRLELAVGLVAGITRAERQADEARRRQYSIVLKRMHTKALLEGAARLVSSGVNREEALLVLQRAGEGGVEVLLDLLVAAPTVDERRGIFTALTGVKEGTDQLVHMLGHSQWFVVRNIAELVGELGLEEAVPALARQLDHEDERVRKAVALALAKTGSRAAAEPLRRALKDKSPAVRLQAALGVGGRKASALAMPLVAAMGEEEDEAVEQELMLALGRIGSPDAVQALIKFAQPGGKLFGRKPTALRVTAVEALRLAATPAAIGTLEGLGADSDKQVRAAAQAALRDLKQK